MIDFTMSKIGVLLFSAILVYVATFMLKNQLDFQTRDKLLKECSNIKDIIEQSCNKTGVFLDYKTSFETNLSVSQNKITLSGEGFIAQRQINCPVAVKLENSDCYVFENNGRLEVKKC